MGSKRLLPVMAGLVMAVTAIADAASAQSAAPASVPTVAEGGPVPVRVAVVALRPATETIRYAATIEPRIIADVGFRVGGKLDARLVNVGDRVTAGMPLARLDNADLQLQVQAVQAQLASARADAANARTNFDRKRTLRGPGWATQQDFDSAKAAADTADAKVRELEASLAVARNNSDYAVLVADGPGVVTAVLAEPGQVVASGTPVLRIARLGEVEVAADVPEQDVADLVKRELTVTLWSAPGQVIKARLREVAPHADSATRTFKAKALLLDPPPTIQLGMTATLIATSPGSGAVAVLPRTVLTKDGNGPAVWVLTADGTGVELRPVTVAAYTDAAVVIAGGLKDGEKIVSAGVQKLTPTTKVRIWTEPQR